MKIKVNIYKLKRNSAGFRNQRRKQSSEEREVSDIFLSSSSCSDDDDEKKTPQKMIMSDNLLEPEKEKRSQRKTKKVDTFTNVSTYLFTI